MSLEGGTLAPYFNIFCDRGVLPAMEQCFVRTPGAAFMSSEGINFTAWCFSHMINDETHLSFILERL